MRDLQAHVMKFNEACAFVVCLTCLARICYFDRGGNIHRDKQLTIHSQPVIESEINNAGQLFLGLHHHRRSKGGGGVHDECSRDLAGPHFCIRFWTFLPVLPGPGRCLGIPCLSALSSSTMSTVSAGVLCSI